jgi:hypothetical protein
MKRQVAFSSLLLMVLLLGGQRLACAHDGHGETHNVPDPAARSDSSFVAWQPELTKSGARISTGAGILGSNISGGLPDSCVCCGSSHEGATVANAPTFFDQKKRGTRAASPDVAGAAAVSAQANSLIPAREHGPPSVSMRRHLLIGILLI